MKFTLKDYQADAARDVLDQLGKARRRWHEDSELSSFPLTATTGAGKTVIAAAVLEALFYGNESLGLAPDPSAVVIWLSHNPALNEQSRFRLMEASEHLVIRDLVTVENTFSQPSFERGKVYFLNPQKLSSTAKLGRGRSVPEGSLPYEVTPDTYGYSIGDTIRNTIEDPDKTLYLIYDEAHYGVGSTGREKTQATIASRLINGYDSAPPIPVVWGISATVERFTDAMRAVNNRTLLPGVEVDPRRVQESGLIKDTIALDVPDDNGTFDTVLVRRATEKLRESTLAWRDYAREQDLPQPVVPLMVLQVPPKVSDEEVATYIRLIQETWPELHSDSFAHVLEDHSTLTFGPYKVDYLAPERVQESTWARVLIAKEAVTTGWDCPRAEVMVSLRSAESSTYITQLMGRMLRTPLARRIPGNEALNTVYCLLPFFDKKSVNAVVDSLLGEETDPDSGPRVLINPVEVTANRGVDDQVWETLTQLPSITLPRQHARPVNRLTSLALELAHDGLLDGASDKAYTELHNVLDAAQSLYGKQVAAARDNVLTVEGATLVTDTRTGERSFDQFVAEADYAVIDEAYRRAARTFDSDLTRTYAEYLARQVDPSETDEEPLLEAHITIAALGLIPEVKEFLDERAARISDDWFDRSWADIQTLSDERKDVYRQLREMSSEPQLITVATPRTRMVKTTVREADGTTQDLPAYADHLLADRDGQFPMDYGSSWEARVLDVETARPGFLAWYRNPSASTQDSLGILYEDGEQKIMRPDFLFFARNSDDTVGVSIIEPHGTHFADALPKLRGLADYAEDHGGFYQRIDSVAKVGDVLYALDLNHAATRAAVRESDDLVDLYTTAGRKYATTAN